MGAEITENIRVLIISKYEDDFSNSKICNLFNLNPCTVSKILKNYRETGSVLAKKPQSTEQLLSLIHIAVSYISSQNCNNYYTRMIGHLLRHKIVR